MGFGLLLTLVFSVLASSHAVFPFIPLFPLVLFVFAMQMIGRTATWHGSQQTTRTSTDDPPALPPNKISKEKELLEALERHEKITATRAALETSLSVAEAEEMFTELSNNGHLRVSAMDGTLVYALWD